MSPRHIALLTLALGLSSREALARTRRDVTVGASFILALPSAYDDALDSFGRDGPLVGTALDARGTLASTRWFRFGVRGGWTHWSVGPRRTVSYNLLAQDTMRIHLFDVSGFARLLLFDEREDRRTRIHLDVEAGPVVGAVTLGGVDQPVVVPRLATSLFFGGHFGEALFGFRVGFQYVPWGGAGGSRFDPVFSGVLIGVEGGWSQW